MGLPKVSARVDELLEIPFKPTPLDAEARLGRVQALADSIDGTIALGWTGLRDDESELLRGAGCIACVPTLELLAQSLPHSGATATEVVNNYRALSGTILSEAAFKSKQLKDSAKGGSTIGQIAEIAVAGALWWRAINRGEEEGVYFLPATKTEDSGSRNVDGYKTSFDIKMGSSDPKAQPHRIQVKKSGQFLTWKGRKNNYYPGIVVISLDDLGMSPHKLLKCLYDEKASRLHMVSAQVDRAFERAEIRRQMHEEFSRHEALLVAA